jgi:hypothetical protein
VSRFSSLFSLREGASACTDNLATVARSGDVSQICKSGSSPPVQQAKREPLEPPEVSARKEGGFGFLFSSRCMSNLCVFNVNIFIYIYMKQLLGEDDFILKKFHCHFGLVMVDPSC